MIKYEVDSNGDLNISIPPHLVERISIRADEVSALIQSMGAEIQHRFHAPPEVIATHPAAQGLHAYKRGLIGRTQAAELLNHIATMSFERAQRLIDSQLAVEQSQVLLPFEDTRGAQIVIDDGDTDLAFLDKSFDDLRTLVGEEWSRSLLVNTVSFVNVQGMPDLPHFSGSTSDIWGAMHMSRPASNYVLAESLTHESSHFWLHCLEEIGALSDHTWDQEVWVSAWRDDPRPIGGVLHGLHVFSCVASVLTALCIKGGTKQPAAESHLDRLAYVIAQVEDGIFECGRCAHISDIGRELVVAAGERLIVPQELIGADRLACMREKVLLKRRAKVSSWKQEGARS